MIYWSHDHTLKSNGFEKHPDKVCDLTLVCVPHEEVQKILLDCLSAEPFEIHNNNKSFYLMLQSQSIGWIKQNPDNNYQTIRIVNKSFVQLFSALPVYIEVMA